MADAEEEVAVRKGGKNVDQRGKGKGNGKGKGKGAKPKNKAKADQELREYQKLARDITREGCMDGDSEWMEAKRNEDGKITLTHHCIKHAQFAPPSARPKLSAAVATELAKQKSLFKCSTEEVAKQLVTLPRVANVKPKKRSTTNVGTVDDAERMRRLYREAVVRPEGASIKSVPTWNIHIKYLR